MKISLKSNSADILKNVILKGSYPFGFTFVSSSIKPLSDNMTWKIGDIPPGGWTDSTIKGKIQGEDSETRVFRFATGAQSFNWSEGDRDSVHGYWSINDDRKTFYFSWCGIDNDTSPNDFVGQFNQNERVTISWFNNLRRRFLYGNYGETQWFSLWQNSSPAWSGIFRLRPTIK